MSQCRDCGKPIMWVRRPDGVSFYPPFEINDEMDVDEYVVEWVKGVWLATPVTEHESFKLIRHKCQEYENRSSKVIGDDTFTPEQWRKIKEWHRNNEEQRNTMVNKHEQEIAQLKIVERERTVALAKRLRFKCSVCGASSFEWCFYKNDPDRTLTKALHTKRGK